jgi:hypothetical protein
VVPFEFERVWSREVSGRLQLEAAASEPNSELAGQPTIGQLGQAQPADLRLEVLILTLQDRGLDTASIALARGDLQGASADSEHALDRARRTKDPQLLAPTLALRGIVQLAHGQGEEAASHVAEVLAHGSVFVTALLDLHPTVTPVEFAWLVRDLGRGAELLSALESAPSTPWHEAARAIADGHVAQSVEIVARIGARSVEAYARLRAAEELSRAGRLVGVHDLLEPALSFFRHVGATPYLAQADKLLAGAA